MDNESTYDTDLLIDEIRKLQEKVDSLEAELEGSSGIGHSEALTLKGHGVVRRVIDVPRSQSEVPLLVIQGTVRHICHNGNCPVTALSMASGSEYPHNHPSHLVHGMIVMSKETYDELQGNHSKHIKML